MQSQQPPFGSKSEDPDRQSPARVKQVVEKLRNRAALYDEAITYLRTANPLTLEVLMEAIRIADCQDLEQSTRVMWSMTPFKEEMRAKLIDSLEQGKRVFGQISSVTPPQAEAVSETASAPVQQTKFKSRRSTSIHQPMPLLRQSHRNRMALSV